MTQWSAKAREKDKTNKTPYTLPSRAPEPTAHAGDKVAEDLRFGA